MPFILAAGAVPPFLVEVVAIVLATNGGTPGGSGLKDEEVAVEFTGAVPDALPARNRA